MARVTVTHHLDAGATHALLTGPQGGVLKDLLRRGKKVESQAKRNLESAPRRVDTGLLRSSIHTSVVVVNGAPAVRVGSNLYYLIYVHDGTGIWGPAGHYIRPKLKKSLHWTTKAGKPVFAKRSRGMRPNHFLKNALPAAKG